MNQIIANTDLLVCNDSESLAWGSNSINKISDQLEHLGDDTKIEEAEKSQKNQETIALSLLHLPKADSRKKRVVIITRGTQPTLVALEGAVHYVEVSKVPKEKVVDTNGAGDTFLGGLFSWILKHDLVGKIFKEGSYPDIEQAVQFGNQVAGLNVQVNGVSFPEDTKWDKEAFKVWN
mmetsp:Transcript_110774/g.238430  ORF Transcript_110774/g.238430 Transcript_110774/m.238430 type:complete len:177 (-) Transcript_110774:78-608(-)|eukprot:CAMPEP_0116937106 /NCGR_PEP_ID=MMETSP0467-20121206/31294_1 /TAXON_ID=283647 /ORGANISM="Mesodinium pulex, Strain SPMC105" /LENGTH=176 /DNA_ID=CAMNT_0004618833 /DNA_START=690 /DNA_END=1220 /DNA_ORIENTATION=+